MYVIFIFTILSFALKIKIIWSYKTCFIIIIYIILLITMSWIFLGVTRCVAFGTRLSLTQSGGYPCNMGTASFYQAIQTDSVF